MFSRLRFHIFTIQQGEQFEYLDMVNVNASSYIFVKVTENGTILLDVCEA